MKSTMAALAALLAIAAAPAGAANLLANADFEAGDNGFVDFPYSNSHYYSYSSAPDWQLYNDHAYTHMSTELLSEGGIGEAGNSFIHVVANAQYSGVIQSTNGTPFNYLSADINAVGGGYVLLQAVSGNDVTWSQNADTHVTGWQHVVLDLSLVPYSQTATQIRIVSGDYFGNDFYVDNVYAGNGAPTAPVPEPGEWAMMLGGLALVGGMAKRRRRAD